MPNLHQISLQFAFIGLTFLGPACLNCAYAKEHHEGFDGQQTSWHVRYSKPDVKMLAHRRNTRVYLSGSASENFEFDTTQQESVVQFEHTLPPARVIDDLKLTVSIKSNRNNLGMGLRIIFPHQKDPRTGKVLHIIIQGDHYTQTGRWQELQCKTLQKDIGSQLVLLRARINTPLIDTRDMYVDRVILASRLALGTTEFFIDELKFGPIVEPQNDSPIVQVNDEDEAKKPAVEFRLDRMVVDGRHFFPRIVPYHTEEPASLSESHLNLVWVPDYRETSLLQKLRENDLWAIATPPRAVSQSGQVLDADDASLIPFKNSTSPILSWYVGTRIPPSARDELIAWIEQIQSADRNYNRPVMADITGLERVYSRHLSMTGLSRHVINTSYSFKEYRNWLTQKRKISRPGSFTWTWIQTEPASSNYESRKSAKKSPILIEPEQIRLQVYTALASGCRGIGYWKGTPLEANLPGNLERRLAITQLNLELELLEPWLATGTVVGHIPFQVKNQNNRNFGQLSIGFFNSTTSKQERDALLGSRDSQLRRNETIRSELEATILRSDYGLLLLPIWYERGAQFTPGQLAANDATIIVPGNETATPWEVTTTGIRSLTRERVAGGIKITLPKIDQTAAVILSADRSLIQKLRTKIKSLQQESSRTSIELARAKLDRVRQVDLELQSLSGGQPDSPQLLARAESILLRANEAYQRQDYHTARLQSADVMQLMRILQRAHWDDAVRKLSSPTASMHTVCFQTLPDHWKMVRDIGRSKVELDNNLLRSGDFEDIDTMVVEGWQHKQTEIEGVRAIAELYPVSKVGSYSLRLVAIPQTGEDAPKIIHQSPVSVTSPPIMVRSGQIVHMNGWVRVAQPITSGFDGAVLYDSLSGKVGALRWSKLQDWQQFELIREVQKSGEFTFKIALNGLGEIQFDDLRIVVHQPQTGETAVLPEKEAPKRNNPGRSALDFLQRLPKLRPLQMK